MRSCPPPDHVERVEAPTREEFERDYAERNCPVIVTGVVDKWRATAKWTPDYLRRVAGDKQISARYDAGGDHANYYTPTGAQSREMTLNALLDGLLADPPDTRHYLSQYQVAAVAPELLEDIDYSRYLDQALAVFFIGRSSYTPNHHHGGAEAALCQVVGPKTVNLYPPNQTRFMYPYPWYSKVMNFSRVDDRAPDHRRFPRFRHAHPLTVTVQPGEMLFIPVHWWHSVSGSDYSVSVTLFWSSQRRRYHFPSPALQVYSHAWFAPISVKGRFTKLLRKLRRGGNGTKPGGGQDGRRELPILPGY